MPCEYSTREIIEAQKVMASFSYKQKPAVKNCTGETPRVDILYCSFSIIPTTEDIREKYTEG
ncbi:hypothetical protein CSA37_02490 [Candidatus Fermentibacteria bacterium]|nr:MAG: hypothetical protein CSA37_02490 [Candidatus Fermentibacteria bacterium]